MTQQTRLNKTIKDVVSASQQFSTLRNPTDDQDPLLPITFDQGLPDLNIKTNRFNLPSEGFKTLQKSY